MNVNEMFEATKQEMIKTIESCTLNMMVEKKDVFQAYFNFYESMHRLSEVTAETEPKLVSSSDHQIETEGISEISETAVTTVITDKTELPVEVSNESDDVERKMYLFKRMVRGGVIPELSAVVPEGIVRKLNIEHHDFMYATEIPSAEGYKKKYHYELAKKATSPVPHDRVEVNCCPIERDGSLLVVSKSLQTGSNIRIHDTPQSLRILEEDIREFCLKEGDIVDVAYIKGKEEIARVVYFHYTASEEFSSVNKSNPSVAPKKTRDEVEEEKEVVPQTLQGQTIFVVGNEPDRMHYKEGIEARGGIFLWSDAKDSFITLQSNVRKSNIVIFLLSVSGHTGMKQIKRSCKANNIPFLTKFGNGTTSMIRMAEEAVIGSIAHM